MTDFIQQVVGLSDSAEDVGGGNLRPNVHVVTFMTQATGGSGYVIGDVGATVILTGGTYTTQATAIIATVSGGAITSLSFGTRGVYSVLPTDDGIGRWAITGGTGTGAKARLNVKSGPLLSYTGASGFSTPTMAGFTLVVWGTDFIDAAQFLTSDKLLGAGFFGQAAASCIEMWGHLLSLGDASGNLLYHAQWAPPYQNLLPAPTDAVCLMLSVDVASHTVQLYWNDEPQELIISVPSGGWHSFNPIGNTSANMWTLGGGSDGGYGGAEASNLISVWMAEGFNDLSDSTFRRNFINGDLSQVDPATYPSPQLSFYTQPADSPDDFGTNHGTGGAWTGYGGSLRWGEMIASFPVNYSNPTFLVTAAHTFTISENEVLSDTLQGAWQPDHEWDYTYRPFAGLNYPSVVTPPTNGDLILNTDGTFTYTPDHAFIGTDTFQYIVEETMPSPCQSPGYSATVDVTITVEQPPNVWIVTSPLHDQTSAGVGNLWMDNTYVDFSDPAVLDKFVNPDGSFIFLGYYGQSPTGTSPLTYLTVQTISTDPYDFIYGYGQNGSQDGWDVSAVGVDPTTGEPYPDMSFDVCEIIPPPGDGFLQLTELIVIEEPRTDDNDITLRWSDDAGASWSNGVVRSMGKIGEYLTVPTWYRIGMARNRVVELSWSGARAESLQGVYVSYQVAGS